MKDDAFAAEISFFASGLSCAPGSIWFFVDGASICIDRRVWEQRAAKKLSSALDFLVQEKSAVFKTLFLNRLRCKHLVAHLSRDQ